MNSAFLLFGKILSAIFIFFLPGYLTSLLLKGKNSFSLLISILLSSLIGLILAQLGFFSLFYLVFFLGIYSLTTFICLYLKRPEGLKFRKIRFRPNWLLLALLALSSFIFFRPHQYLEGGWDPGTYLNTGINIAKSGSIKIEDETWAGLKAEEQEAFSHNRVNIQQKYPGFMITDSVRGRIIPRFYHLYPVWIAIFYSLFGLRFSLYLNPCFALLGLLAFYQAARILFNRKVAGLASLFLALSVIQIWYVRFSTTEIFSQFLLWNGIYLLALYEKKNEPFPALIGALTLGAALLSSFTIILILPALVLYFFYRNWGKFRRFDLFFIVPFSLLLVYLLIQGVFFTKTYIYNIYWYHYKFNPARDKAVIALGTGLILLILLKVFSGKIKPFFNRLCQKKYLRRGASLLLVLLAFYLYFLRPRIMPLNNNATNAQELALFLTPLGFWLAIFGLGMAFWQGFSRKKAPFVIMALTFSFFFLRNKVLAPSYPWALRRYVPFMVPSFYLFASYLIIELSERKKITGRIIATAICIYLLVFPIWRIPLLIKQVDYQGMIEFSENLAKQMKEEAIYICDGYWLATPLHYIYGKNTLSLSDQNIPKAWQALSIIEKWLEENKQVFYISRESKPFTPRVDFQEVGSAILDSSRLEEPLRQIPRKVKKFKIPVKIFQLKLLERKRQEKKGEHFIDIGRNCFGLAGGFDRVRNYSGGINGRWTYGLAEITIPWPEENKKVSLTIKMGGARPKKEKLARISLYLDGNFIKEFEVANEFKEYNLIIPSSVTKSSLPRRAVLRITATVWNPYEYAIKGYSANLGVLLDWVKVKF